MSYENKNLRCRNCRFWWPMVEERADQHPREHATRGQCRRHAPQPVAIEPIWAITQSSEWCGEHSHVNA
jgi:hypothetical protein